MNVREKTLLITLGESVDFYKTISTTHITIIQIPILLRDSVAFKKPFPQITSPIFKSPSMTNEYKEEQSSLPAGTS